MNISSLAQPPYDSACNDHNPLVDHSAELVACAQVVSAKNLELDPAARAFGRDDLVEVGCTRRDTGGCTPA